MIHPYDLLKAEIHKAAAEWDLRYEDDLVDDLLSTVSNERHEARTRVLNETFEEQRRKEGRPIDDDFAPFSLSRTCDCGCDLNVFHQAHLQRRRR